MNRRVSRLYGFGCLLVGISLSAFSGCSTSETPTPSEPTLPPPEIGMIVESGDDVDALIGDGSNEFRVINHANLSRISTLTSVSAAIESALIPERVVASKPASRPADRRPPGNSLVVGYPIRLLGESSVFGGVVTKVSDPDNELYGNLKLVQLPALHARPYVAPLEDGGFGLALIGCNLACTETSPPESLLTIPILGVDFRRREVILDISTLGQGLGLSDVFPPVYVGLEEVANRAISVDYSMSTLVFDIESELVPLATESGSSADSLAQNDAEPLFITMRWYLELGSRFEGAFEARAPIPEVGYFTTIRSSTPRISRFAATRYGDGAPIRYYIKNVPEVYQGAFSAAFDDWNAIFREVVGYDLMEYHHIGVDHPLNPYLVTGDPRFNIVEWDIDNLASYGGLGPAIAHGFTGETIAGMVLIQGPDILRLYREWFRVGEEAAALRASGDHAGAERLVVSFHRELAARPRAPAPGSARAYIGDLEMIVPAQDPSLHDARMAAFDFDILPTDADFDTFMQGYMRSLAAHEIGHNLGLRHNFMGSLSGDGDQVATHSVMEYVVRNERHKSGVGAYDHQAIAYGYGGVVPDQPLPFCSDLGVPNGFFPFLSAECSNADAGPDPFAYHRDIRVERAVDLVIGRGLGGVAPEWTPGDVFSPLFVGLMAMASYGTSAEATSHTWNNFFNDPSRPTEPEAIYDYALAEIQSTICSPSIVAEIELKHAANPDAGQIAKDNWVRLLADARIVSEYMGVPFGHCDLVDTLSF